MFFLPDDPDDCCRWQSGFSVGATWSGGRFSNYLCNTFRFSLKSSHYLCNTLRFSLLPKKIPLSLEYFSPIFSQFLVYSGFFLAVGIPFFISSLVTLSNGGLAKIRRWAAYTNIAKLLWTLNLVKVKIMVMVLVLTVDISFFISSLVNGHLFHWQEWSRRLVFYLIKSQHKMISSREGIWIRKAESQGPRPEPPVGSTECPQ